MPSTQHTQACVLFLPPALEMVDQDREPSEKLGSQIEKQV